MTELETFLAAVNRPRRGTTERLRAPLRRSMQALVNRAAAAGAPPTDAEVLRKLAELGVDVPQEGP